MSFQRAPCPFEFGRATTTMMTILDSCFKVSVRAWKIRTSHGDDYLCKIRQRKNLISYRPPFTACRHS